ncbi:MAG: hypothetical protein ACXW2E_00505 [Nitrososphaeraceae archaeon]
MSRFLTYHFACGDNVIVDLSLNPDRVGKVVDWMIWTSGQYMILVEFYNIISSITYYRWIHHSNFNLIKKIVNI